MPTDDLTFNCSVGCVHSNYKSYLFLDPATNTLINVADEVHNAHVPDWTGNVGIDWLAAGWNVAKLRLNVAYSFQAETWNFRLTRVNPYNSLIRQNDQQNLSARFTLEDVPLGSRARLAIQVYDENLLNHDQRINSVVR